MAIAIALCMSLICFNSGFYIKFEEIFINQRLGHIQIQNPSYSKTKALQDSIRKADEIYAHIRDMPQTKAISGRLQITALAGTKEKSAGVVISGIIPQNEKQITTIHEQMQPGGNYISDEPKKEIIIGYKLKEELKIDLNDELLVYTQAADGSIANDLFTVIGIYKSGSAILDRGAITHLTDLQEMMVMQNEVHEFIVISQKSEQPELLSFSQSIQKDLKQSKRKVYTFPTDEDFVPNTKVYDARYGEGTIIEKDMQGITSIKFSDETREFGPKQRATLELVDVEHPRNKADVGVRTWWQSDPTVAEMMGMRDVGTGIFLGLVFFIAGFGILNTMMMSVFERTREIGILKALGFRPRRIVFLIIVESILLSCLSALLGILFGGFLIFLLVNYGMDISGGTGKPLSFMGANIDPVIYGHFSPSESTLPIVALFCISVLASLWPAIRAARLKPVEAIRQE